MFFKNNLCLQIIKFNCLFNSMPVSCDFVSTICKMLANELDSFSLDTILSSPSAYN